MINLNLLVFYIFLLKLLSLLIYFYYHPDINISYFYIGLFIIFIFYFIIFYIYRFTKFGIMKRIESFTTPLIKLIPVIKKNRKCISQFKQLHDYKLSDFYIFSSHNTYVAGNQNMDVNSLQMIKIALQLGIREIELDVYAKNYLISDKEYLEPIVTHGIENTNQKNDIFLNSNLLTFDSCIEIINENAFVENDDPLIINIELNTHNIDYTNNRILEILKNYFGDRLIFSNSINNLKDMKMKDLINKVIIVIHDMDDTSILKDLSFDYSKNVSFNYINEVDISATNDDIIRVFPPINLNSHFSYNCDPYAAWNKGIQVVSCNIQNIDNNLQKHFKKFKNFSFLLKPKLLRNKK